MVILVNNERYNWPDKRIQSLEESLFVSPFLALRYILKQKIPKHEPVTEATPSIPKLHVFGQLTQVSVKGKQTHPVQPEADRTFGSKPSSVFSSQSSQTEMGH